MNVALLHRFPAAHQAKVRIISGQAIAKSKWGPHERAEYAARWKLGAVQVDPTVKLAAAVFEVSVPLVAAAIDGLAKSNGAATPAIDSVWAGLANDERVAFVRRHLPSVWDVIDRVTTEHPTHTGRRIYAAPLVSQIAGETA